MTITTPSTYHYSESKYRASPLPQRRYCSTKLPSFDPRLNHPTRVTKALRLPIHTPTQLLPDTMNPTNPNQSEHPQPHQNLSTNTRPNPATTKDSTPNTTTMTAIRPRMKPADESIATQQLQDRVFTALMSHQLLLRYAIANDLVSPFVLIN